MAFLAGQATLPPQNNNNDKLRWSDLDEQDDGNNNIKEELSFLLPPRQVLGPDENGIKKVIEYKFNENGQNVIRVTTTTRVRKTLLKKGALERRSWPKFGDAVDDHLGSSISNSCSSSSSSRLTMVSTEEIALQRHISKGSKVKESETSGGSLTHPAKRDGILMVCRIYCKKGDHWTSMCPYKDVALAAQLEVPANKPSSADGSATSSISKKSNNYIQASMRAGTQKSSNGLNRNDESTVRVSCISEDTSEADLVDLFSLFGQVSRVFLATDRRTGLSRGFAFITFVNREGAQRAINKLDGYGYDNLILHVEWCSEAESKRSSNASKRSSNASKF